MADLVQVARASGKLVIFAALLESAAGQALLRMPGPLTLFAPSDAALAMLPLDHIMNSADIERASALLIGHAAHGALIAADLMQMELLVMLSGQTLPIDTTLGLRIAQSYLTDADAIADQGVLHIIERVLPLHDQGA
jgi:uncharacterized surface protein with fasciclin (FAS1) repeats